MSLVGVRTSSFRYVQSTGDRARITLARLFLVNTLGNRDQFCSHAQAARLTSPGGTSPRGVSPLRQAPSPTQPRAHGPGIFLLSGNIGPFPSRFWALVVPSGRQSPSLTNETSGSSQGTQARLMSVPLQDGDSHVGLIPPRRKGEAMGGNKSKCYERVDLSEGRGVSQGDALGMSVHQRAL